MECSILAALLSLPSPFLSPSQVVSMINLHPPHPSRYSSLHEQEEEKGGGDVFRDIDELSDDHPSFLSSSSSSLDLRRKARQRLNLVKQVLGVVGGDVLMRYNVYQQWSIYRREEEEEGEKKKKSEVWCQRHLVDESILRKVDPLISYIRGCMHKFQLP
ncbi:helicase associated domain protein, partial [Cystoisospora suis]